MVLLLMVQKSSYPMLRCINLFKTGSDLIDMDMQSRGKGRFSFGISAPKHPTILVVTISRRASYPPQMDGRNTTVDGRNPAPVDR